MAPPSAIESEAVTDIEATPLKNPLALPLEVNEVLGRRKKALASQWSIAAPSDSDSFKLGSQDGKPCAKRWDHYLTQETQARIESKLKGSAKHLGKPGLISVGGGLPSSELFPFDELSVKVPQIDGFTEEETHESGMNLTIGKHDMAEGKSIVDLGVLLNYGQGSGSAQLLRWMAEHTEIVHDPPYRDWQCTMTVGSTYGTDMVLRMLAQRGDYVLSEEYTFATMMDTIRPLGIKCAGVRVDAEGLLPDALDSLLECWDPQARDGAKKPHLLYTVPSGQNPTGATQSAQRRREIYAVCQKHDVIIIEDEPYYYLQMDPYNADHKVSAPQPPSTHKEFLKSLVPSYLSMDIDGRVFRMDSFSKVVAPGSRTGWVTASAQIIERYKRHADMSTQSPSGFSQLILFKLLDEHWGHGGYLSWLMHIRKEYTKRRNIILDACEQYLPKDIVSWVPPAAGMFHWMKIEWKKHPLAQKLSLTEIEEKIFLATIENGALAMRGSWFSAEPELKHEDMFFRATFAAAPADRLQEAMRRFGLAIRQEFGLSQIENEANGHNAGNGVNEK